jgi:hypothetical protein
VVCSGVFHGAGFFGGEKRTGGAAKGMPRNLFTMTFDDGRLVLVPITTPESSVAVGEDAARSAIGLQKAKGKNRDAESRLRSMIASILLVGLDKWKRGRDAAG